MLMINYNQDLHTVSVAGM